jgi:hypothetical protein
MSHAEEKRRRVPRRSTEPRGTRVPRDLVVKTVEAIARELDGRLSVVGVVGAKAGSDYIEVLVTIRGCEAEPCRLTLGVTHVASQDEISAAVRKTLEAYLRRHAESAAGTRGA